jgi:formate hydrogenlyase subunit 6/NADH:ubiquinone oxidoreductase subunit I
MANKKRASSSNIARRAFSSIFKKSATQKYPFVKASVADGFRGKQIFDIEKCISCGLCSKDCPANAIEMIDVEGKKRPLFHLDRCVFCYQCADTCPKKAIQPTSMFELACIDKKTLELRPQPLQASVKQPTS